jgi:hypothetical protein
MPKSRQCSVKTNICDVPARNAIRVASDLPRKSEASNSKFAECPVCSRLVPFHTISSHVEAHFASELHESNIIAQALTDSKLIAASDEHGAKQAPRQASSQTAHRDIPAQTCSAHTGGDISDGASSADDTPASSRAIVTSDWSFLRAPGSKDIRGARRMRKALDAPPQVRPNRVTEATLSPYAIIMRIRSRVCAVGALPRRRQHGLRMFDKDRRRGLRYH